MTRKGLQKLALVIMLVLAGFIVLLAFPAEADRNQVEHDATATIPAGSYEYRTVVVYVPATPESSLYIASFSVPGGGIVKFYAFNVALFQLWQEGKYQPSWMDGSRGDFGMSVESQTEGYIAFYLVAMNEASSSQEVRLWLSRSWHESNYLGLLVGSAIVSFGIGAAPLLVFGKNKHQLAYAGTIFAMSYIMIASISAEWYRSYPPYPTFIYTLTESMPGILFFEAFPLIILLYLLERNNAFAYFRSWNVKEQLQISSGLLVIGFMIPLVFMIFRMVSLSLYLPLDPQGLTIFSLAIGGILMFAGFLTFIGLYTANRRRRPMPQLQTQ